MNAAAVAGFFEPGTVAQQAAVALLLAARMLPLSLLAPWLAVPRAPFALSLAVTAVLVLCLQAPALSFAPPLSQLSLWSLLALAGRELLLGLVLALPLALPVYAFSWSGAFMGHALFSPDAARTLSSLARVLGAAAFFALGGHRVALRALAGLLAAEPLGAVRVPADALGVVIGCARLLSEAFSLCVLLALPVLAAMLLVELGLALAARFAAAPVLPLLGPPLRPLFWLAASAVALAFAVQRLPELFARALAAARALWEAL